MAKWRKLDPDNIEQSFRALWGSEHGGYFSKRDARTFNPPEYLPYKTKAGYIHIPEIASNDAKFQKKICERM
jgi:hypothetical protein